MVCLQQQQQPCWVPGQAAAGVQEAPYVWLAAAWRMLVAEGAVLAAHHAALVVAVLTSGHGLTAAACPLKVRPLWCRSPAGGKRGAPAVVVAPAAAAVPVTCHQTDGDVAEAALAQLGPCPAAVAV